MHSRTESIIANTPMSSSEILALLKAIYEG